MCVLKLPLSNFIASYDIASLSKRLSHSVPLVVDNGPLLVATTVSPAFPFIITFADVGFLALSSFHSLNVQYSSSNPSNANGVLNCFVVLYNSACFFNTAVFVANFSVPEYNSTSILFISSKFNPSFKDQPTFTPV